MFHLSEFCIQERHDSASGDNSATGVTASSSLSGHMQAQQMAHHHDGVGLAHDSFHTKLNKAVTTSLVDSHFLLIMLFVSRKFRWQPYPVIYNIGRSFLIDCILNGARLKFWLDLIEKKVPRFPNEICVTLKVISECSIFLSVRTNT